MKPPLYSIMLLHYYICIHYSQGHKGSKGDMGMPGMSGDKGSVGLPGLPVRVKYFLPYIYKPWY